ncbi:unnamed protein product [Rotaria sp. Silwood2]|nr:unnamed protein product [Rotaria sp. Silwood2]
MKYVRFRDLLQPEQTKIDELLNTIVLSLSSSTSLVHENISAPSQHRSIKLTVAGVTEETSSLRPFNQWTPESNDVAAWFTQHRISSKLRDLFEFQTTKEMIDYGELLIKNREKQMNIYTKIFAEKYYGSEMPPHEFYRFATALEELVKDKRSSSSSANKNSSIPIKSNTCVIFGKFLSIIEKLDYLSDLGINAIELMPIMGSKEKEHDWGYLPRHFFCLKSTYGSINDLKLLVDKCHQRKIRVFLDCVFNHSDKDASLALIDRNYWYYKGRHHPDDPFWWGPEFNYEFEDKNLNIKPAVKFITDVVKYWIREFHLDGIRFDADFLMNSKSLFTKLECSTINMIKNFEVVSEAISLNSFTGRQYVIVD